MRITRRPRARPARPAPRARTSRTGDVLLEDGSIARPAPARRCSPSVGTRAGAVAPAPAGRGHVHRRRAARAGHDAGPRLDLRLQLLHARRRGPRRRRDRLPGRASCPTTRREFADALSRPAGPRRPRGDQRRGQQGRLRRRQGGARPSSARSSFGEVAMQPGKPQGFGFVGEDAHPDLHAARQPGLVVRLLRGVRPAGAAPDDGPAAVPPARWSAAVCTRGFSSAPGTRAVRPRRGSSSTARGAHVTPGRRARLAPDRRPVRGQRADRGAAETTSVVEAGSQVQVLVLDRDF